MADEADEEPEAEPAVELGTETPVEGQPLARVAARLTWPHEVSRIDSRQAFVTAVEDVIGTAPVEPE